MNEVKLYLWLCMLLAVACAPEEKKVPEPPLTPIVPETTDMTFHYGQDSIPPGFILDTLRYTDTVRQVSFTFYYFKGVHDSLQDYNHHIVSAIQQHIGNSLVFYGEPLNEFEWSTDEYGPQKVVANQKWISTQFISDSYTEGGNHHNYGWFSLNYDREKKRMIWFKNEFKLRTRTDSLEFRSLVGRHLSKDPQNLHDCCNDTIDFFFAGGRVEFGPCLSWAEGLQTAMVDLDSLVPYLNQKGSLWQVYHTSERGE